MSDEVARLAEDRATEPKASDQEQNHRQSEVSRRDHEHRPPRGEWRRRREVEHEGHVRQPERYGEEQGADRGEPNPRKDPTRVVRRLALGVLEVKSGHRAERPAKSAKKASRRARTARGRDSWFDRHVRHAPRPRPKPRSMNPKMKPSPTAISNVTSGFLATWPRAS